MLSKLLVCIATVMILLVQAGCATTEAPTLASPFDGNYEPITRHLSSLIRQEMKSADLVGLSIALVDNQKMIWSEGFGYADKAKNVKANAQTKYRAGSVSKLFNAIAIMGLVEQGQLDLDAPIVRYLPEFKVQSRFGTTKTITLRSLLTHHSGLPGEIALGMWGAEVGSLESILELLPETYTSYPANHILAYSNLGVALSGLALQKQSDQSYSDYLQEHLLDPLNMNDSDFTGKLTGSWAAAGYIKGRPVDELPLRDIPAGGLNSTVEDLSQFLLAMLARGRYGERQLLGEPAFDEMLKVQNNDIALDLGQRIGLAWFYDQKKLGGSYDIALHGGRTAAHSSLLAMVPELGMGVVVMSNSPDETRSLNRIVNAALSQLYTTRGLAQVEQEPAATVLTEVEADSELTGRYAGLYGLVEVEPEGDRFNANALQLKLSLRPEGDHWFSARVILFFIPVLPDALKEFRITHSIVDEKDVLIALDGDVPMILGEKIVPMAASELWNQRLGDYEIVNPEAMPGFDIKKLSFKRGDEFYYFEYVLSSGDKLINPVKVINDTELVVLGLGAGLGVTISYIQTNEGPEFRIAGLSVVPIE